MWEKLLLKPGYYTVQVVILLDFDWSWEYFTDHPDTLNNSGCELTALMCLAWWTLLPLLGAAKSVLDYWLNTLVFSVSKLHSSLCEMAQNIHLLGGVLGVFLHAKKAKNNFLSFRVCFVFVFKATVASILYTVQWAWLEDAGSLGCMQWCLGLLCLLVSMYINRRDWQRDTTLECGKPELSNNKAERASNCTLPQSVQCHGRSWQLHVCWLVSASCLHDIHHNLDRQK